MAVMNVRTLRLISYISEEQKFFYIISITDSKNYTFD